MILSIILIILWHPINIKKNRPVAMVPHTLALGYINLTHSNYHHYTTVHEWDSSKGGSVSMVLRISSAQKVMEEDGDFCQGGGGMRHSMLLCERQKMLIFSIFTITKQCLTSTRSTHSIDCYPIQSGNPSGRISWYNSLLGPDYDRCYIWARALIWPDCCKRF